MTTPVSNSAELELDQAFEDYASVIDQVGPGITLSALEVIATEMPQLQGKAFFVIDNLLEDGCADRLRKLENDPQSELVTDPVIALFLALSRYNIPRTTGSTAHIRTLSGGLPLHIDDEAGHVLVHTFELPAEGYQHIIYPHSLPAESPDSFLANNHSSNGCVSRADLSRPEAIDMRVNRGFMMAGNALADVTRRVHITSGLMTGRPKKWASAPHSVASGSTTVAIDEELPEYDRERLMVYAH